MIARKLFKKRKSKKKFIIIISLTLLFLIIFYYFFLNDKSAYIVIPENNDFFYIIPEDRGGKKVENIDKKSLNLKSAEAINNNIKSPNDLLFSIQIFSDTEYENVNNYLKKIINFNETVYQIDDFYILALQTDIGIDYYLTYKNFETRQEAQKYCLNFLTTIENCLIVDTTKF